jgi:acyl phosphate:glycerol-3-phosphate acyltransferase
MIFFLIAAVSYLLGSIPFGYILVRIFRGEDVRRSGSGNIGATNVARSSPVLGILTLVLDAGKGVAAVLFALALTNKTGDVHTILVASPEQLAAARHLGESIVARHFLVGSLASLFAIIGHLFPVWLRFRGGKGVATALGSLVVIAPKSILCALGIFALLFLLFRYVSLSSVIAVGCFPLAAWFFHEYGNSPLVLGMMALSAVLIIWKHRVNLRRLLDGTEPKFSRSRA